MSEYDSEKHCRGGLPGKTAFGCGIEGRVVVSICFLEFCQGQREAEAGAGKCVEGNSAAFVVMNCHMARRAKSCGNYTNVYGHVKDSTDPVAQLQAF